MVGPKDIVILVGHWLVNFKLMITANKRDSTIEEHQGV